MKISNVLLAVDENQWISIIDEFGYRIFRGCRKSALESIPDLEVTEIASAGSVLIIEVRKCVSDILDLLSMYDRAILKIADRNIWEGRAYTMSEKFGKYFVKSIHPHSSDTIEIVLF